MTLVVKITPEPQCVKFCLTIRNKRLITSSKSWRKPLEQEEGGIGRMGRRHRRCAVRGGNRGEGNRRKV